jgi:serine/threonine protein kinase
MIGQTISHYRILEKLGEGGMGEVYLAEDTRLGRKVALKLLPAQYATDAERVRRFEQEAKAASALNHPNILTIYDIGTHQGAPFIVSELLEGETLRERLQAGALPARKTIDYVLQLSRGLAAAHGKGIIHRDLKPENLFITEDARLKILDFGLAKLKPAWGSLRRPAGVEESTETYNQGMDTDPGKVMGTVGYMAPEQVRGQEADYRSDIFAVGVILYEMLSGKRAFARQSAVETMNAILKEEPPDLEEAGGRISPGIARVVNHCLEKNPEQRFQSASDLAFALEALSGTSSGSTMSPESGPPADMRPMKFSILLPEKASLGSFAVSPDGRWLAFTAGTGGQDKLRVRALEVLASQELTGTDGASFPFWSPDSRSIGFFASGKLKKIEVSGGPVQTLCDAGTGLGGTWNRDGVIVFTTLGFGMFRVAAMGGSATLMTPIDRARADYHSPSFLPDGRHFLYYTRSGRKETRGIYLGSLDTDSNAVYAPSLSAGRQAGYLLFMREGALLAQPFDTQQLRLTGELLQSPNGSGEIRMSIAGIFRSHTTACWFTIQASTARASNSSGWIVRAN